MGLLGGSFNPAHEGHLFITHLALRALRLDEVWWLVSPQNPLKPAVGMAPLPVRLKEAAHRAGDPRILVTDIEQALGTQYTAETLSALAMRFPATRFVWLMGADNLAQIPRWRRWQRIFHTVPVAVFARPPYSLDVLSGLAAQKFKGSRLDRRHAAFLAGRRPPAWIVFHNRPHPASATEIRRLGEAWTEGGRH